MARKNITKVFQSWLNGTESVGSKNHSGSKTIWTDGRTIYSYAMPIAVRMGDRSEMSACVSKDSPTVTTSHHLGAVRYLLSTHNYSVTMMADDEVKAYNEAA